MLTQIEPPSRTYCTTLFTLFGFFGMGLANTILSLPFFYKPHRIILGTVGGFFTGYVAHDATVWASAQAERSKEYRKRLLAEREKIVKEYEERQNKH